jgi:hypothetical protein
VNARVALKNTFLPVGGGWDRSSPIFVSKGTQVGYSVYSMHRRPDFYGLDAEAFRPERWQDRLPKTEDPLTERWAFLPFNAGPRTCLGCEMTSFGSSKELTFGR